MIVLTFDLLNTMGLFSTIQAHKTEHSATPSSSQAELDIDQFFAGHDKIFKEQAVQTLYAKRVIILNDWFLNQKTPPPTSVQNCIEQLLLAGFTFYLPIDNTLKKIDTLEQLNDSLSQFTYLPEQDIYQLASEQLSLSPNEVQVADYLMLFEWCKDLATGSYEVRVANYLMLCNWCKDLATGSYNVILDHYSPSIKGLFLRKAFLDYLLLMLTGLLNREHDYLLFIF